MIVVYPSSSQASSRAVSWPAGRESCLDGGFSLTEVLVVVAIVALVSVAMVSGLRQKIDQSRVDSVATRLEAALNGLRRQSLSYQTSCQVSWSPALISNQAVSASADQIGTALLIDPSQCQFPTGVPLPRFSPPLNSGDSNVQVTISPVPFTITAFGGLSTPPTNQPLILTVQPNRATQQDDFVRCLQLAPYSGAISRGTWVAGNCQRNR